MRFMMALFKGHGKKALREITDQVASLDPSVATQAQLEVMETELNKLSSLVAELKVDADREQREADEASADFELRAKALVNLQDQLRNEADPERKAKLEVAFGQLLTELEGQKSEVLREQQEAVDAAQILEENRQLLMQKGQELQTARANLQKMSLTLKQEKTKQAHAERRAEVAAQAAGLRENSLDSLHGAQNAFTRQIEAARKATAQANLKSDSLAKPKSLTESNDLIQQALTAAKSGSSTALPADDRVAALLGKPVSQPVAAALPAPSQESEA